MGRLLAPLPVRAYHRQRSRPDFGPSAGPTTGWHRPADPEINPELRRRTKAVSFGIVYGLSAFGLAAQPGNSRQEARTCVDNYFARYAGVRRFIEETIAQVRACGYTRTLFGREAPPEEAGELAHLVKHEMENAHALEVPVMADVGAGANWRDAK